MKYKSELLYVMAKNLAKFLIVIKAQGNTKTNCNTRTPFFNMCCLFILAKI